MASAGIIGSIGEFEKGKETITEYFERFESFLDANVISDPVRKRAVLLATIGAETYKLIRALAENKPKEKSYVELKELLTGHLHPKPNVISQRYKFFKRDRNPQESVSDYIATLRKLSEHCSFGATINEHLRDRIVCGINNDKILQKLLAMKNLTLQDAIDHSIAIESAARDTKEIRAAGEHQEVLKVETKVDGKNETKLRCYRCGDSRHLADKCYFKSKVCYGCQKTGHSKRMCKAGKNEDRTVNAVEADEESLNVEEDSFWSLYKISSDARTRDPVILNVDMNGKKVQLELDTGAAISVMSLSVFNRIRNKQTVLKNTNVKLKTYTGELVKPSGVATVEVSYCNQKKKLPITVVDGNVPSLLGRNWLSELQLDWKNLFPAKIDIKKLEVSKEVQELINDFPEVFTDELGKFKDFKVNIPVPSDVKPKFFKARPVPYSLKERVEEELEKLEKQGVRKSVVYSKWAAPMVPVQKDGNDPKGPVRICGDYKVTVNKVAPLDTYPIPCVADQLATFKGGKKFSKIDLKQAYQQLELDEESQELLTISTHRGLYQPTRLQFGVHSATGIFQRIMDQKLAGIPMTKVRVDDIIVSGIDDVDHMKNLKEVLVQLKESGLTAQLKKCIFMAPEVPYCGHIISEKGIRPIKSNVEAVLEAPAPTNISELRAFLGMVNYYHSFVPNLATVIEPLHVLLRKGIRWNWSDECQEVFDKLKNMLSKEPLLAHFNPNLPIIVHVDASPYGLGAVLSHVMPNGEERPVSFCSRTLSAAERNYAHIEKEGLAMVFAVKKFNNFLHGYKFDIFTDHKPLLGLFSEQKELPVRASSRVLRWALLLSGYNYTLKYRSGESNGNADGLSRLPMPMQAGEISDSAPTVRLLDLAGSPVTNDEVRNATRRDPVLSKLLALILSGQNWESSGIYSNLLPFKRYAGELTTEKGCILWGARVVIPEVLRKRVLEELHLAHPGISRMKALARSYVWWPKLDADIEVLARSCTKCILNQENPAQAPIHPWEFPSTPWQRVHVDHAGPMDGETYLVVVDAYSKWLEVVNVKNTSSEESIRILRNIFATHGLPEILVTDNGSSFGRKMDSCFDDFCRKNGIMHVRTAPYHPSSNGPVERYVGTFKSMFKKVNGKSIQEKLDRVLFHYRTTPHSVTGVSPAEKIMNRRLRTALDSLKPGSGRQARAVKSGVEMETRHFDVGENVLTLDFSTHRSNKWEPGQVVKKLGSTNYQIRLTNGDVVHRHIDQIVRCTTSDVTDVDPPLEEYSQAEVVLPVGAPHQGEEPSACGSAESASETGGGSLGEVIEPRSPGHESPEEVVGPRRSTRVTKRPERFSDYI